eukprot:9488899-Pyramimonas_sp.AAC.1
MQPPWAIHPSVSPRAGLRENGCHLHNMSMLGQYQKTKNMVGKRKTSSTTHGTNIDKPALATWSLI